MCLGFLAFFPSLRHGRIRGARPNRQLPDFVCSQTHSNKCLWVGIPELECRSLQVSNPPARDLNSQLHPDPLDMGHEDGLCPPCHAYWTSLRRVLDL